MSSGHPKIGGDGDDSNSDAILPFPNRAEVLDRITKALESPPVGLVLLDVSLEAEEIGGAVDELLFLHAIEDRISTETGPADIVLLTGSQRLTIIKPGLRAPAEAEGFALRVKECLHAPMLIGDGFFTCQAAIGVAVSKAGDTAGPLARFAEHALGDAEMLGGDTVVAFDDQDRALIIQ